jgi:hypothetical protein
MIFCNLLEGIDCIVRLVKMATTIDFNTLPVNAPSMCIPRVFKNVTRDRIIGVFRDLDLGIIERIDILQRENEKGDKFQRVFVHFKKWFRNANADKAREMLIQGKEIKVIYDDPWFWKISTNKSKGQNDDVKRKPQIEFEDKPKARKPRTKFPVAHIPVAPIALIPVVEPVSVKAESEPSSPPHAVDGFNANPYAEEARRQETRGKKIGSED